MILMFCNKRLLSITCETCFVRSFAYAGPSNWNSLPAHLRDNSLSLSSFKRHLKTFLFSFYYRLAHAARARVGFFYKKTHYINSLLLLLLLLLLQNLNESKIKNRSLDHDLALFEESFITHMLIFVTIHPNVKLSSLTVQKCGGGSAN